MLDAPAARPFRQGLFFDGDATRQLVVNGALEFFADNAGVFSGDSRGKNILVVFQKFAGDFQNLFRRFSGAENHFGETFAQGAVCIHLRKADVGNGRSLESLENFIAADAAGAKFFQELSRFSNGHAPTMPQKSPTVTRENGASTFNGV